VGIVGTRSHETGRQQNDQKREGDDSAMHGESPFPRLKTIPPCILQTLAASQLEQSQILSCHRTFAYRLFPPKGEHRPDFWRNYSFSASASPLPTRKATTQGAKTIIRNVIATALLYMESPPGPIETEGCLNCVRCSACRSFSIVPKRQNAQTSKAVSLALIRVVTKSHESVTPYGIRDAKQR